MLIITICYIGEIHDEGIFKGSISIKVVRISSYHLWKIKNMFGDNIKQVDFANRKIYYSRPLWATKQKHFCCIYFKIPEAFPLVS